MVPRRPGMGVLEEIGVGVVEPGLVDAQLAGGGALGPGGWSAATG